MNFMQQAYKGKNSWWRYLITMAIVFAPFIMNVGIYLFFPEILELYTESTKETTASNLDLVTNLLPFLFLLIVLFLLVKMVHKREAITIITSRETIDWSRFFYGFKIWGGISLVLIIVSIIVFPGDFTLILNIKPFLILLLVSLLLFPFQTAFEEVLFRGYLMQSVGLLAKNKWFPLVFSSILFGLLHGLNPEVEKLGMIIMIYYIGTGLVLGIITLMDEGTELALGFHAANNITAAVVVTTDWTAFKTHAIYLDTSEPSLLLSTLIPVFVLYPLILMLFSKKYGWKNWKEKITGKIIVPVNCSDELPNKHV